jgi:hypothetical protein
MEEVEVFIPDSFVFRDDRLVWKQDVSKGSLIWPLETGIQKIDISAEKLKEINEVGLSSFVLFK